MKNTPRIRVNGGTNSTRRQVSLNTRAVKPLAPPGLENGISAPDVVRRALDELDLMQHDGRAASALLVLLAAEAKSCSETNADWERLEFCGFGDGLFNLAQIVIAEFQTKLKAAGREINGLAAKLKNPSLPMPEEASGSDIEEVVGSLSHIIHLLGVACSDRRCEGHQIDHHVAFLLCQRLAERFDGLFVARAALFRAVHNQTPALQAA